MEAYAFGQRVPQSEIDALLADGLEPDELTTEFLEGYYYYDYESD